MIYSKSFYVGIFHNMLIQVSTSSSISRNQKRVQAISYKEYLVIYFQH